MKTAPIAVLTLLTLCSIGLSVTFSPRLVAASTDDEFAEFDDFVPVDSVSKQQDYLETSHQQQQSIPLETTQDSKNKLAKDDEVVLEEVKKPKLDEDAKVDNKDQTEDKDGTSQKKPDLKLVNAPLPRYYKWESYYIEIAFLFACLLYFANYIVGSGKNQKFAQQWYEQSRELLKQQFTLVGGAPQINDGSQKHRDDDSESNTTMKKQKGLIMSTQSMYTLWNSGRIGMDGLLVEMNLLKRQDLFSMALDLLKPSTDNLILRFLLTQDGYENFVFCLAHKTQAPKLTRDMVDINTFCTKRKPISQYGIPSERLFVMSELSDVTSFIFDDKTIAFIKKHELAIKYIHITDQFSTVRSEEVLPAQKLANPKRMATFSFNFPHNSVDRVEYFLFSLSLLDRLRRFKLAKDSKQKSEKNRQKITDILQKTAFTQRQEAAQNKKEELRRQEKERIYNEDDPEKQKRWEKKEAKRELKKNKMRVKQLKVKSM